MNIAKFSIEKTVITWLTVFAFIVGGIYAFNSLGQLEDPEFTIKDALVFTPYPGASPLEVEEEVTDKIETAIQKLPQVKEITSKSYAGMSEVTVSIKNNYDKTTLPQVWDELRRKVNDVQSELPPGVKPSMVNDDFGDVFGLYFAISGQGFSYRELYEIAKSLRKELLLIDNVAKIDISGNQQEQVFIEASISKLANIGISPGQFYSAIQSQNLVAPSGVVKVGDEAVRISPSGDFVDLESINNLLIHKTNDNKLIYLKDIATVSRGYKEVPLQIIKHNGQPAVTLGISLASGGNIVELGKAIDAKREQLQQQFPAGIEINPIYNQAFYVEQSVNNFIISLVEAVLIVIVVLLFFMGLRSGLIIGSVLLITIFGTFVFMGWFKIDLQRISLGALVIALGMLVDNAIVVAEGIMVRMQAGEDGKTCAIDIVKKTMWPLLGATIVGILAFAPIGLSDDSTGEYCSSLFYVILISLLLSWYLAITVTPLFCVKFLKFSNNQGQETYDSKFYTLYKALLLLALRNRKSVIILLLGLMALTIFGFGFVKQSFFPNSMTPMFYFDYWREQGTDIRAMVEDVNDIENYILQHDQVESVSSYTGKGASRFMLTYTPEQPNSSYAQLIIKVKKHADIAPMAKLVSEYVAKNFPNSETKIKYVKLGSGGDAEIEAKFSGNDPQVLRKLANQAKDIMRKSNEAINIKDDWRQRTKIVQPEYSEAKGRAAGISRSDLKGALQNAFSGTSVGLYRENDELLPIIARLPEHERLSVNSINDLQIWSRAYATSVPIQQVVNDYHTEFEDQLIRRDDRKRTIVASCDSKTMVTNDLFKLLRPQIEAMELPVGYELSWGGEYEDSTEAKQALGKQLPSGVIAMVLAVILLFGTLRQPLIIWLTVPLAIIGVTAGLLITNESFGFMSLLGLLSLSGMLIKNAIVLIDQIDYEIKSGIAPYKAVVESSISRVRPVSLAAITTILGMIPLLQDVFFISMAVTIMAGLAFATVLTLIVVPVLYSLFFKIVPNENLLARES